MSERKEKFGIGISVPVPFLQKDLEAYQVEFVKRIPDMRAAREAEINRQVLSTAIVLGWVEGLAIDDIPGIEAYKFNWAAAEVLSQIRIAQAIPKK